MMTNTDKTFNNQAISYEIVENGYKIYLGGKIWIEQIGEYSKPMNSTKTYEENCLAQIDELITVTPQTETLEDRVSTTEENITQLQIAIAEMYEMGV